MKRFFPSEFGSDTTTQLALDYFPGWGPKVEIRDYLKSKEDKIEWTVVFNGFFFDWCATPISSLRGFLTDMMTGA